jgi:hypothetical protein
MTSTVDRYPQPATPLGRRGPGGAYLLNARLR